MSENFQPRLTLARQDGPIGGLRVASMTFIFDRLLRPGSALRDVLITSAIVCGLALMLGALVYRLFVRPEWSSVEAFDVLWPYHAGGALTLLVGWLIDRREQ